MADRLSEGGGRSGRSRGDEEDVIFDSAYWEENAGEMPSTTSRTDPGVWHAGSAAVHLAGPLARDDVSTYLASSRVGTPPGAVGWVAEQGNSHTT